MTFIKVKRQKEKVKKGVKEGERSAYPGIFYFLLLPFDFF